MSMNKKSLKNLKSFKPGVSGNPAGRPSKKDCLTSLLKEEIEKINPKDKSNRTWKELIVLATIRLAIAGNSTALKEVWERVDGKVMLPVGGLGDGIIPIHITYEPAKRRNKSKSN